MTSTDDGRPAAAGAEGTGVSEPSRPAPAADGLLWLALLPSWTDESASAAAFPSDDIEEFLAAAAEAGWAERWGRRVLGPGRLAFWARASQRLDLIGEAVRQSSRRAVLDVATTIAERLRDHHGWHRPPTRAVIAWTELVLTFNRDGIGRLTNEVRRLVREDRLDQATEMITAAEALEPVAGQPLTDLVQRSERLLHLGYRRRSDARALGFFVRRSEQLTAVRDLLRDPGGRWALHILGIGGTGKTMLIRYLASGLFAADAGLEPFPVARVDFDRLSPNYPVRQPLLLLLELAEELELYAETGEQERALTTFYSLVQSVHAASVSPPESGVSQVPAKLYDEAVSAFARLVQQWGDRVLVVLDTCEELAKVYPAGGEPPPLVDQTFRLLQQVQREAPALRVLLAGRRPMTRGGPGWPELAAPYRDSSWLLPAQDYLGCHEILGFTMAEARELLAAGNRGMPPDGLVEQILARSPASGTVLSSDRTHHRYNPYKLVKYRQWWEADPGLDLGKQAPATGDDAYVEARIIERLGNPQLVALLPAIAELGQFDELMIAPLIGDLPREKYRELLRDLADQEWIDIDIDPLSGTRIFRVEELLRPDLRTWADRPAHRKQAQRAYAALRESLTGQVTSADLDRLSADHVVGALRLSSPLDRRGLWQEVERRVAVTGRWDWMDNVLARVRGEFGDTDGGLDEIDQADPILCAQLQATIIAVQRRGTPIDGYEDRWRSVLRTVESVGPVRDMSMVRRLRLRAELGIAATRTRRSEPEQIERLRSAAKEARDDPRLAGSVIAAMEGVTEHTPAADLIPLLEVTRDWLDATEDQAVRAALRVQAARLVRSAGTDLVASSSFASASAAARDARGALPGDGGWADWVGPSNCLAWVLLHDARNAYLSGRHLADLPILEWEETAHKHLGTIDGERLMSACLQLRLGFGVVRRRILDTLAVIDVYDPDRQPQRAIHDAVPPLFVSVSDGYFALGDADQAVSVIRARRAAARKSRREDATLRHADEALMQLARRRRMGLDRAANEHLARLSPGHRHASWAAGTLTDGSVPWGWLSRDLDAEEWHACWTAQQVDPRTGKTAVPEVHWLTRGAPPDDALKGLLRQDAAEVIAVGSGAGVAGLQRWLAEEVEPLTHSVGPEDDELPLRRMRYQLAEATADVLQDFTRSPHPTLPPLVTARVALEIGELRALRVPDTAIDLLGFAARLAEPSSPVLALQASAAQALAMVHAGRTDASDARKVNLPNAYKRFYEYVREHTVIPSWEELVQDERSVDGPWCGWLERVRIASLAFARRPVPEWAGGSVELYGGQFGALGAEPLPAPESGWPLARPIPRDHTSPAVGHATDSRLPSLVRRSLSSAAVWTAVIFHADQSRWIHLSYDPSPPAWAGHRLGLTLRRQILRRTSSRGAVIIGVEQDIAVDRLPEFPGDIFEPRSGPGAGPMPGRLVILAEEQPRPWEEALAAAIGSPSAADAVLWYRSWPARGGRDPRWVANTLCVHVPSHFMAMVERSYRGRRLVSLPDGMGRAPDEPSIVQLIGRPVFTTTGVLYQVSERRALAPQADEVLIAPGEFGAERASLVVVQGMPYDGELRVDPFESGQALQFAVDTMIAGAAAVLLVPALPIPAAEGLLALLDAVARDPVPPNPPRLITLAADVKALIDKRNVEGPAEDLAAVRTQVRLFLADRGGS